MSTTLQVLFSLALLYAAAGNAPLRRPVATKAASAMAAT
jgi:hypothetical protein